MTPSLAQHRAPVALSFCGRFVVTNDLHPVIFTISEAREWQARAERRAADYERDADLSERDGKSVEAEISRGMASINLTVAADLAEVLAGAQQQRAA